MAFFCGYEAGLIRHGMGTESTVLGDDGTWWVMILNGHCQSKLQRQCIMP